MFGLTNPLNYFSAVTNPVNYFGSKLLGNAIDYTGRALGLPEMGISEAVAGMPTATTGQPSAYQVNNGPLSSPLPAGGYNTGQPAVKSASISPATSGGGGTTNTIGSTGGGTGTTAVGATDPNAVDPRLQLLMDQFKQGQSQLEGQIPGLDASYKLQSGQIQNYMNTADKTATNRVNDLNNQFGNILRDQVKSYNDLGQQRTGMFTNLGTTDSSAYQDMNEKARQNFSNQQGENDRQKNLLVNSVNDQLAQYKNDATTQLGQIGLQYDQSRKAITDALAQGNMQEASQLSDYIQKLKEQAQNVQNNMQNWAIQAGQLEGRGINVSGILNAINANGYAQQANNQISSANNAFGDYLKSINTSTMNPSMFQGKSGKTYSSMADLINAGDTPA